MTNTATRIILPAIAGILLCGFVVMLITGAYYTAHPQNQGTALACNIYKKNVTGVITCTVQTFPRSHYNKTISCDGVTHEITRVPCWVRHSELTLQKAPASGGMIAVLVIGAVGIVCVVIFYVVFFPLAFRKNTGP